MKYGYESHRFEIIELCSIEDLNDRERFYQDKFNVLGPNGLNCRLQRSNDKSGRLSKDTIIKLKSRDMSYMFGNDFRTGIPHCNKTKCKISKSLKGKMVGKLNPMYGKTGSKNHFFGKKHSKKTRELLRKKSSEKIEVIEKLKKYNEQKKTQLIDKKTGTIYDSIRTASIMLGINYATLKAQIAGRNRNKTNLIKYEE